MERQRNLTVSSLFFASNAVLGGAFGLLYVLSPRAMPYHLVAMSTSWTELGAGEQAVLMALMRVAGGGFVAAAIASAFLLHALRAGDRRAPLALLLVQLAMGLSSAYAVGTVMLRTSATTPWPAALLGVLLPIAGYAAAVRLPRPLVPRRAG